MPSWNHTGLTQVQAETARLRAKLSSLKKQLYNARHYLECLQKDHAVVLEITKKLDALEARIAALIGLVRVNTCSCVDESVPPIDNSPESIIDYTGATATARFTNTSPAIEFDWQVFVGDQPVQTIQAVPFARACELTWIENSGLETVRVRMVGIATDLSRIPKENPMFVFTSEELSEPINESIVINYNYSQATIDIKFCVKASRESL